VAAVSTSKLMYWQGLEIEFRSRISNDTGAPRSSHYSVRRIRGGPPVWRAAEAGLKVRIGDQPFRSSQFYSPSPARWSPLRICRRGIGRQIHSSISIAGLTKPSIAYEKRWGILLSHRVIETRPKRGYRFIGTLNTSEPLLQITPIQPNTIVGREKRTHAHPRAYALWATALVSVCWLQRGRLYPIGGDRLALDL
jgi:hypothetical protein